ncbi:MAG: DNA polymerase III subunit [Tenericutes bacterium]|nr:DNA polymerase III subunit [Mycoplasmatota bacterium]
MDEIVDYNEKFVGVIENIISFNKLSHAYIIEVNDYDSDYLLVEAFVKLILCKNNVKKVSDLNCDKCEICRLVDEGNYPDVLVVEPDGKEIKKGQLLDLQKEYNNKSMLDSNRVYIIKEADKLNLAAANSILKFLEEPEDNIVAILLTKNRYQIIDTILSRCQIIALKRKTPSNVDSDKALTFIKYMLKNGELFVNYKEILDNIMPDKLVARQILEQVKLIFIDYLEGNDVMIDLSNVDKNKVVTWVLILESEMKKLDYNVNYKLWLDSLYVKLIGGDRYV